MKNIRNLASHFLLCALLMSCGSNKQMLENEILSKAHAVKTMNSYDEMNCVVYEMGSYPFSNNTSIDRFIDDDCIEGTGSFELKYSFGKTDLDTAQSVFIQQTGGDYRSDLSFHPLGLSIWIKGNKDNKGTFRFLIIQDKDQFSPHKPYNRDRWQYFEFTDDEILSKEGWNRLIMPYEKFTFAGGLDSGENKLLLNRYEGYKIEVVNSKNEVAEGQFSVDNLQQLTSFKPDFTAASKFSSVFIQLNGAYENTDWDAEFKASNEIGIDTWIIQYAEGFDDNLNEKTSYYTPTNVPWVGTKYSIINRMFEAAERNSIKLILGLYPGDYSRKDNTNPEDYQFLAKRNFQVFDELYNLWGNHPNLVGWYITEEFHDGSFPVGWQQEPALSLLANYLQTVAAYIKAKSPKEVSIAPALWRGMPADLCGEWYAKIFSQTPDIDMLYLQDVGGRCLADFDVDLPNWFAEIKKACDANGVEFGVDIESFMHCWCPDVNMKVKPWLELEEQLRIAGLFTKNITNFSWATFNPGTETYEGYKEYLKNSNK